MTNKDPSAPIHPPALEHDTRRGEHPCLSCRHYFDPATQPADAAMLDLMPFCKCGFGNLLLREARWRCYSFAREPGDQ